MDAPVDSSWTQYCALHVQVAMARTKKLCAVVVDTLGREVMVRRPCVFGPDGWPAHPGGSLVSHVWAKQYSTSPWACEQAAAGDGQHINRGVHCQ
jgi:hypothetical protein